MNWKYIFTGVFSILSLGVGILIFHGPIPIICKEPTRNEVVNIVLNNFSVVLSQHHGNERHYPETIESLLEGQPAYIMKIPKDPWGNRYQYNLSSDGRSYKLYSLGSDGVVSEDDIYISKNTI